MWKRIEQSWVRGHVRFYVLDSLHKWTDEGCIFVDNIKKLSEWNSLEGSTMLLVYASSFSNNLLEKNSVSSLTALFPALYLRFKRESILGIPKSAFPENLHTFLKFQFAIGHYSTAPVTALSANFSLRCSQTVNQMSKKSTSSQ